MRDATNSVAPRDIAHKPPAEGKENDDKDDGFFFADPAGLTTPAPALPAKAFFADSAAFLSAASFAFAAFSALLASTSVVGGREKAARH